jgi:hypothetical protein
VSFRSVLIFSQFALSYLMIFLPSLAMYLVLCRQCHGHQDR